MATYNHGLINFMQPATAIANLAFTRAFDNTIETVTEATLAKINDLRNKIRDKFRENYKVGTSLASVEKLSKEDLEKIAAYLYIAMSENDQFSQKVKLLAHEINQEINIANIQAQNVQNVYGDKTQQNNAIDTKAPVIQGGSNHIINFNYNEVSPA
ncbi:hypothetical protein [Nostoc sp. 'Peltigera malacea cyanobiont' DB3992]|uniref:hypothetical protein n=1 Tax=Nostoc sp. 'Peltigera malacea cyanobiont' DB3992 TaxID=1206980 RepID=UPI00211EAC81|nr:hypothetical protein [Nostoc sp. 'Peltigera malacea cyanobiont' DB3992]